MDNIFSTEQNEFFSNKQNAKILYLQNQNAQLQEDIEDLQNSLKLNKEALQLAYQQMAQNAQNQNNTSTGNNSTLLNNKQQQQNRNQPGEKEQNHLLEKLIQENKHLADQNEKLRKERSIAYTKALIQEQIQEESQSFQKEIVTEQDDKILELRRIIHDKEYAIQEFEKMHPEKLPTGTVIKTREIIAPSEQSIKLHLDLENLRHIINRLTIDNQSLNQKNQFLLDFNNNLKREIIKMRVVLSNPVNYNKMRELISTDNPQTQQDNIELSKYFYSEYFKNEEEEQIARDFVGEQKYQDYIQKQDQLLKMNNKHEIQNQNYTMSRQQLFEKIDALEYIIENYRVLYSRETTTIEDLNRDIQRLQQHNKEILDTNELLINSNKQHQERVIQQHREVELYKSYYYKYMEFIKNRRKHNLSSANTPINIQSLKEAKADHKFKFPLKQQQKQEEELEDEVDIMNKGVFDINKDTIKESEEDLKKEQTPQKKEEKKDGQEEGEEDEEENIEVNVSILEDENVEDNNNNQNQNNQQMLSSNQNNQMLASHQNQMLQSHQNNQIMASSNQTNNLAKLQHIVQSPQQQQPQQNNEINMLQQQQQEQMHEMNIVQCKKYLLNLARELYINLSNNNATKGITRMVLKRIQLGHDKPGNINLFRTKRSLSNPLDYTSPSFLEKLSKINDQAPSGKKIARQQQQPQQYQQILPQEQLLPNIHTSPSAQINQAQQIMQQQYQQQIYFQQQQQQQQQFNSNNNLSNQYYPQQQSVYNNNIHSTHYEEDYDRQQQMYTQQCNYDFNESKRANRIQMIQKSPNQEVQFQTLVTQMNNPNDDYSHVQIPPQTQKQMIQQGREQLPIRINMNKKQQQIGIEAQFDKIDKIDVTGKGMHKKKITIQQFNDVDCSFISNGDELNF